MNHQVKQAIIPQLSLRETVQQWGTICNALTEGRRKRTMQVNKMFY